jgi:hypothetical protein
VELSASETILLATCVALMQCYWHPPERPRVVSVILQVSLMAIAVGVAERVYVSEWFEALSVDPSIRLPRRRLRCF